MRPSSDLAPEANGRWGLPCPEPRSPGRPVARVQTDAGQPGHRLQESQDGRHAPLFDCECDRATPTPLLVALVALVFLLLFDLLRLLLHRDLLDRLGQLGDLRSESAQL